MNIAIIWPYDNVADDKINIDQPTTRADYTHK